MPITLWKVYCASLISNGKVYSIYKNVNNFIVVLFPYDYVTSIM
jgi:hypothetical protein